MAVEGFARLVEMEVRAGAVVERAVVHVAHLQHQV